MVFSNSFYPCSPSAELQSISSPKPTHLVFSSPNHWIVRTSTRGSPHTYLLELSSSSFFNSFTGDDDEKALLHCYPFLIFYWNIHTFNSRLGVSKLWSTFFSWRIICYGCSRTGTVDPQQVCFIKTNSAPTKVTKQLKTVEVAHSVGQRNVDNHSGGFLTWPN